MKKMKNEDDLYPDCDPSELAQEVRPRTSRRIKATLNLVETTIAASEIRDRYERVAGSKWFRELYENNEIGTGTRIDEDEI